MGGTSTIGKENHMISLDLQQIVFSRRETIKAISTIPSWPRQNGIYLRHAHGGKTPEVYRLEARAVCFYPDNAGN